MDTDEIILDIELMSENELKRQSDEKFEELYKLKENEKEIEKSDLTTSVKGMHLIYVRRKKMETEKYIKEIALKIAENQYIEENEEEEREVEDAKDAMEKLSRETVAMDKGTLETESEDKYYITPSTTNHSLIIY